MKDFEKILNLVSNFFAPDKKSLKEDLESDILEYDLTTDEGYNDFMLHLDKLVEDYNEYGDVFNAFGLEMDELFESIRDLADAIHENATKNKKAEVKDTPVDRKVVDYTEEKQFRRPSELLDVERKLQLHGLVQEYVDTMIKPFNNGVLTNDQINDAYAGLFEFGAWILNK